MKTEMRFNGLPAIWLGHQLLPYAKGLSLQAAIVDGLNDNQRGAVMLLLQHAPVFTIGKRGSESDFLVNIQELRKAGVDIVHVPRGGETTYHGPGQLVAYPIVNLRDKRLGARAYVELLEDSIIDVLRTYGLQGYGRVPGRTGVWVGDRKIAAVGVRISHGISTHGIAINVTTDLNRFKSIVPCGILDKDITSLQRELLATAGAVTVQHVARRFSEAFSKRMGYSSYEWIVGHDNEMAI